MDMIPSNNEIRNLIEQLTLDQLIGLTEVLKSSSLPPSLVEQYRELSELNDSEMLTHLLETLNLHSNFPKDKLLQIIGSKGSQEI